MWRWNDSSETDLRSQRNVFSSTPPLLPHSSLRVELNADGILDAWNVPLLLRPDLVHENLVQQRHTQSVQASVTSEALEQLVDEVGDVLCAASPTTTVECQFPAGQ